MKTKFNRSKLKSNDVLTLHKQQQQQLKLTLTNNKMTLHHNHSQYFPFRLSGIINNNNVNNVNTKYKSFSKHINNSNINLSLTSRLNNTNTNNTLNSIVLSSPSSSPTSPSSKHQSLPNINLLSKRRQTLSNIKQITSSSVSPLPSSLIQPDISSLPKTTRKTPIFSSTLKLNEYLIHYYPIKNPNPDHITEYSKLLEHVADDSYDKMNHLQSKRLSTIANGSELNLFEKSLNDNAYNETQMKEVKNKYYEYIMKKKLELNMNVFNKIKATLGKREYTSHSILDDLNYNNLKRVIKLKKILNSSNEEKVNERLHKKLNKKKNDIIANIKYDDMPSFAKKKFRKETLNKFKCASCSFFGIPV